MALTHVDFFGLRYDHQHRSPVLFLKHSDKDRYLPVWIGELEASSIELAVIRKRAPRPLTHDLFVNVLAEMGVRITKVVIDRLESKTYYATIFLEHRNELHEVDCRPSDAIALALRENAEILVDDSLMYAIKFVEMAEGEGEGAEDLPDEDEPEHEPEADEPAGFQDFLRRISPSDFKEN